MALSSEVRHAFAFIIIVEATARVNKEREIMKKFARFSSFDVVVSARRKFGFCHSRPQARPRIRPKRRREHFKGKSHNFVLIGIVVPRWAKLIQCNKLMEIMNKFASFSFDLQETDRGVTNSSTLSCA